MTILIGDLLSNVFSHLTQQELYECMKVSRHMYFKAIPFYYSRVTVEGPNHQQFLKVIKTTHAEGRGVGNYIRELTFRNASARHYNLTEEEVRFLIKSIPYVHKLVLPDYNQYSEYLKTVPLNYLKDLREISYFSHTGNTYAWNTYEYFFFANVHFQDRIVSFHCCYPKNSEELKLHLPGFTSLKHLYMKPCTRLELIPIMNLCSNRLSTLQCFHVGNPHTALSYMTFTNLKTLKIVVFDLTNEQTNWIMQYIPNLSSLTIIFVKQNVVSFLGSLDKKCTIKFQDFLRRINHVDLYDSVIDRNTMIGNSPTRMETISGFMRGVNGPGFMFSLKTETTSLQLGQEPFVFKKRNNRVEISAPWLLDVFTHNIWTSRIDFLTLASFTLLNKQVYGQIVSQRDLIWETMNSQLIEPILLQLKQQNVPCQLDFTNFYQRLILCNQRIDINHCIPNESLLCMSTTIKIPSIHYGYAKSILLTTDIIHSLGQLYPDIRELTLEKCRFEQNDRPRRYILDLSCFSEIRRLTLDIDMLLRVKSPCLVLYILFITPTGTKWYCYDEMYKNTLHSIEDQDETNVSHSSYIVQILCRNSIKQFTFRRLKKLNSVDIIYNLK